MAATICLNMIVKNESKVIRRCLDSVRPIINRWVIVDTGSTDGTQDIIREHLRDVPGQLFERPWKDFGTNRTEAIELSAGEGDYLLFMDADDYMVLPNNFVVPSLEAEAYYIQFDDNGLSYRRLALVKQGLGWRYVGVLHEYLHTDKPHRSENLLGPVIRRNVGGTGLTEAETVAKYRNHAAIFEAALREDPGNARYVFYLAQSYRDSRQLSRAVETYLRRAGMGGWAEEVWCAKYQAATLSEKLGAEEKAVAAAYLDAYEYRPSRAEPLVDLARYYRIKNKHALARLYAERAYATPRPDDLLFVDATAYDWRAADELSIALYWTGEYHRSAELCRLLLSSSALPPGERSRVESNLRFSLDKLPGQNVVKLAETHEHLSLVRVQSDQETLESILEFTGKLEVMDVGAAFIAEVPRYKALLDKGCAMLNAFDADRRQHDGIRKAFGSRVRLYDTILGDGKAARLHLASAASGMSSLLEPDRHALKFFNGFEEFGTIHDSHDVKTQRLDDIAEVPAIDFLKMDVQGSEFSILCNGAEKLANCVAIQLEISFVALYQGQVPFGVIDGWMRDRGFMPHAMTELKRWSVAPLTRDGNIFAPFNQLLEGDIVYFREFVRGDGLTDLQLRKLAMIAHYCYGSPDVVTNLIEKLVRRGTLTRQAVDRYIDMINRPPNPTIQLRSP